MHCPTLLCYLGHEQSYEHIHLSKYHFPQIVDVIAEEEAGWWKGALGGKVGVFPSNFVEELLEEPKPERTDSKPSMAPAPMPVEAKPLPMDTGRLPINVAPVPISETKPPVAEIRHFHDPKADETDSKSEVYCSVHIGIMYMYVA